MLMKQNLSKVSGLEIINPTEVQLMLVVRAFSQLNSKNIKDDTKIP